MRKKSHSREYWFWSTILRVDIFQRPLFRSELCASSGKLIALTLVSMQKMLKLTFKQELSQVLYPDLIKFYGFFQAGSGTVSTSFEVRLNQCGTTSSGNTNANGQPNPAGSYVESTIIVQVSLKLNISWLAF